MSKKRTKRKIVGHRDAVSGEFVSAEFANEHPETTVAVTEEIPTAQQSFDEYVEVLYREQGDQEC